MSDLISRQAVRIALLNKGQRGKRYKLGETWELNLMEIEEALEELPSVEPERKTGKWIKVVNPDTNEWVGGFKCSECDRDCVQMSMNYCANCGAPMEVEE